MKKITEKELINILAQHKIWIGGEGGMCADLEDADLEGANLEGADLYGANLRGAKLTDANLHGAYLYGAKIKDATFDGADLTGTILEDLEKRKPTSIRPESNIRSEFEQLAKKHGLHITCMEFKLI